MSLTKGHIISAARARRTAGVSLIETAVFIIVLGLIMAGILAFYKTKTSFDRADVSRQNLQAIQTAMTTFMQKNGRIPCPASFDAPPDDSTYGKEANSDCSNGSHPGTFHTTGFNGQGVRIGAVPVRTLNIPDSVMVDGWGRRIVYAATERFATPATADLMDPEGAILLVDKNNNPITAHAANAIYAAFTHGEDARGAYSNYGKLIQPCDPSAFSGENCNNDAKFIVTALKSFSDESTSITSSFAYFANLTRYDWHMSEWGGCEGTCFEGVQTRIVECKNHQGHPVPDARCQEVKPPVTRPCSLPTCSWYEDPWSACSNTCGDGTQSRNVACKRDSDAVIVDGALCKTPSPASSMACTDKSGCEPEITKCKTGCGSVLPRPDPPPPGELKAPTQYCFFYVSGQLVSANYEWGWFSEIGTVDEASNMVGPGSYASSEPFARADATTFDGIAVGKNTRVTIYDQQNFAGNVIIDVQGPIVINNHIWSSNGMGAMFGIDMEKWKHNTWPGSFDGQFPPSVRHWSHSDMHAWGHGTSLKVSCN